jgi:hypothetical protein
MARFFFLMLLLMPAVAHADVLDFTCPENLQADQSVARVPHGWLTTRLTTNLPERDGITVFDGPPGEMASLVPDNEPAEEGAAHFWTFPAEKSRSVWMQCFYAKQSIYMMRALPDEVTKCTQTAVHTLSCE